MITISETALERISELKARLGAPVKGIRVRAIPRSALRAEFAMRFVPEEEPESGEDAIHTVNGIDLYIPRDSAPYLEGAKIDYVFRLVGGDLEVDAPLRKLDTPDSHTATRIQQVLEDVVNPSLAAHGGGATLIDFKDGVVSLELTGGCQGCSMAGATLKEGIEVSIRESVPEVEEVRDVTRHANGMNPFYQ
jgi:Fe/S biogenesis protein NfuA